MRPVGVIGVHPQASLFGDIPVTECFELFMMNKRHQARTGSCEGLFPNSHL